MAADAGGTSRSFSFAFGPARLHCSLGLARMNDPEKAHLEPWHRRFGRAKFLGPYLLVVIASVYAFVYLAVAGLMFVLNLIVPHLPWISKPYVSPDAPPLVTAFYCANFVLGYMVIAVPIIYIVGPQRQIRPLWPKKNAKETKT